MRFPADINITVFIAIPLFVHIYGFLILLWVYIYG